MTKNGLRTFDARAPSCRSPWSRRADAASRRRWPMPGRVRYWMVVRHVTPAVRPDDVLAGSSRRRPRAAGPTPVTRLAQGPLDEAAGTVADPLAPDRRRPTGASTQVPPRLTRSTAVCSDRPPRGGQRQLRRGVQPRSDGDSAREP